MEGGTEAFPDLGRHCEEDDCRQLDFLPFRCDGCRKVFCLEHRSYKDHSCPKGDHKSRLVVVCEICAVSIERKPGEDEEGILKQHTSSGECDPNKKHKAKCPVKRCRELLTFSNTSTCKLCSQKICLKHRFPSEHACSTVAAKAENSLRNPLARLAIRSGTECREKNGKAPSGPPSVKAF